MTEKNTEKKEFFIFLLIAYGVTYLMGLLMWYGSTASIDLSAFPNAQMMYPASGVMLAYLAGGKKKASDSQIVFGLFLLTTAVMVAAAVLSLLMPEQVISLPAGDLSVWVMAIQFVIIGGKHPLLDCASDRREGQKKSVRAWVEKREGVPVLPPAVHGPLFSARRRQLRAGRRSGFSIEDLYRSGYLGLVCCSCP